MATAGSTWISRIIHYSKSLYGDNRPAFLRRLADELPAVHQEFERFEREFSFQNSPSGRDLLTLYRRIRQRIFMYTVRPIVSR